MKITIGTNTYGNYDRQAIAVDSWNSLKNKFPNIVNVIDIQFKDEEKTFKKNYELDTKFDLIRSSLNLFPNSQKKLPFVNDLIKIASSYTENDDDYFIFTNSDVIINSNLIKYIVDNKPECFACSRLDIHPISSFDNLKAEIRLVRWEIAGFDTFVFKKSWYIKWAHLFNDYLLGRPEFDHVYAGIMKCYGDNTPFGNHYPPFCFHVHHGLASVMNDNQERQFNVNMMKDNPFDALVSRLVFYNLKTNLLRRSPMGAFINPAADEKEKETEFFKEFLLATPPKLL
jgi:hypothetical protein